MRSLQTYLQNYYRDYFLLHRSLLWQPVLFCVLLVVVEYGWGIERHLPQRSAPVLWRWLAQALYVLLVWGGSLWLVRRSFANRANRRDGLVFGLGVAIYAFRIVNDGYFDWIQDQSAHWSRLQFYFAWYTGAQWVQMLSVVVPLLVVHWLLRRKGEESFMGLKPTPLSGYGWLLAGAVPLVALAASEGSFTAYYPLFARIFPPELAAFSEAKHWGYVTLFQLSYALDFFATELFFRGFLILAFVRWLGPAAILPMAVFYVTIHFGKPLGETISSFFGGYLLGIFAYYSRSIWGGVLVHIGLAWLMELAGGVVRFWF